MSTRYFGKEIASSPILVNGAPVQFQPCGIDHGVIAVDDVADPTLAAGLEELATKRVGGVYRLSEAQFEEKKSLKPVMKSVRSYLDPVRLMPQLPPRKSPEAVPAAVAAEELPAEQVPGALHIDSIPNNAFPPQQPQREVANQSLANADAPKFVPRTQRLAKPKPKEQPML